MKKSLMMLGMLVVAGAAFPALSFVAQDRSEDPSNAEAHSKDELDRLLDGLRSESQVLRERVMAKLKTLPNDELRSMRSELEALSKDYPELKELLERAAESPKSAEPAPARLGNPSGERTSFSQTFSTWENGNTTTFQQDADGKFTVRSKRKGEAEVVNTYDSVEAFKAADPERYAIWKKHADAFQFRIERPDPTRLQRQEPAQPEVEPSTEDRVQGALNRMEEMLKKLQDRLPEKLDGLDNQQLRDRLEGVRKSVEELSKETQDVVLSTRKLLEEVRQLAPSRTPDEGDEDPFKGAFKDLFRPGNDPFHDMFKGGADPFEQLRRHMKDMNKLFEKQLEEMGKRDQDLFRRFRNPEGEPEERTPKRDADEDF